MDRVPAGKARVGHDNLVLAQHDFENFGFLGADRSLSVVPQRFGLPIGEIFGPASASRRLRGAAVTPLERVARSDHRPAAPSVGPHSCLSRSGASHAVPAAVEGDYIVVKFEFRASVLSHFRSGSGTDLFFGAGQFGAGREGGWS